MKTTLRIAVIAASLAIAAPAYAQGGGGGGMGGGMSPEQRMAAQKQRMFEGITLNAAQTAKVDSIMAAAAKAQQEMMAGGMEAMRSPEGRAKMQAMTEDRNKALKAVLTGDQVAAFEKNLANMPQGRGRGGL
jgi:Spy/CpxP family protein refolding chaperone